ncbi:hypothetical protein [Wenxinia saemankumensis]|uniref:Methyltransferase n=1 Tax=Wenxinia saemankumensis TaxID=1447782 RepID=A0A1M6EYW7_9RHOB|nr:hypothetical protein [Wenxinia saemankumensis]SHI90664.1 hypothetical protein SAMN05444417_2257 [Wenxinia saemankumensis]
MTGRAPNSPAVMARRIEPADSLDFFPTPPWATRALCERLGSLGAPLHLLQAWEPACGQGDMARPLSEYFDRVTATDVHDHGGPRTWQPDGIRDFLLALDTPDARPDWIITNPPFRLAREFAETGLAQARAGVALLVRTAFLEGGERLEKLFRPHPPTLILQFAERVPMVKGRLDAKVSSATAYCWIVWDCAWRGPTLFEWIAPCRARLTRPGDYPETPAALAPARDHLFTLPEAR